MSDSKTKGNLETEPVNPYWNLYTTTLQQSADAENRALHALQERYGQESAALEKSRARAQENARVSYAKLQKYLPTILKQQGLAGLGVSQSAALRMNNTHANRMGQIESDYASALEELSARYGESRAAVENQRAERGLAAYQTYLGAMQQQEQFGYTKEHDEQTRADNLAADAKETFIELLNSGGFKTSEEMYRYLDEKRDVLGDLYDTTRMTADTYAADLDELYEEEEKAKEEEEAAAKVTVIPVSAVKNIGKLADGEDIRIEMQDGTVWKPEIGTRVDDNELISAASEVKNGQIFQRGGTYYFKHGNAIYSIQARAGRRANMKKGYANMLKYLESN